MNNLDRIITIDEIIALEGVRKRFGDSASYPEIAQWAHTNAHIVANGHLIWLFKNLPPVEDELLLRIFFIRFAQWTANSFPQGDYIKQVDDAIEVCVKAIITGEGLEDAKAVIRATVMDTTWDIEPAAKAAAWALMAAWATGAAEGAGAAARAAGVALSLGHPLNIPELMKLALADAERDINRWRDK